MLCKHGILLYSCSIASVNANVWINGIDIIKYNVTFSTFHLAVLMCEGYLTSYSRNWKSKCRHQLVESTHRHQPEKSLVNNEHEHHC